LSTASEREAGIAGREDSLWGMYHLKSEIAKYAKVVRAIGLKLE
jgi:hypothetical protein